MIYEHYKPKNIEELVEKSTKFSEFRDKCKRYLTDNNVNFDKFTVVDHDSEIGYLSEKSLELYLKDKYPEIQISSWEEECNIRKILDILARNLKDESSKKLVKDYFYDTYDLKLSYKDKSIYIDVKTAKTEKEPNKSWKFLYPKVQAEKRGKDYIILVYCIYNNGKFNDIVVVGAIKHSNIKNCNLVAPGSINRNYSPSRIENYETSLSKDYMSINDLIKILES